MAYEMLKNLHSNKEQDLLGILAKEVQPKDVQKGQKHCFWKDSFEVKECRTEKFIQQKLDYIHLNPCKAKLVELAEQYEHSSAKYYYTGKQGIYPVTNFMELRDIDLTALRT